MYDIFVRLLADRGVTTADVCKATGISQSTLSNWKKRNNILSPALLGKIADYFGVSLDFMMGKDDNFYPSEKTIELNESDSISIKDYVQRMVRDSLKNEKQDNLPSDALDLWSKYQKASPEVQDLIDMLLEQGKLTTSHRQMRENMPQRIDFYS